jgi:hypothetical protein
MRSSDPERPDLPPFFSQRFLLPEFFGGFSGAIKGLEAMRQVGVRAFQGRMPAL